jgi:RNA polymerase sigma-70 factor (ECF subfamily)
MTRPEDAALVRACLEGDPRSFEVLVDRYYKILYNVALRMLHDAEDARDVTQTAFLKAYEKLATYRPEHKFFSWIYRILANEALNTLARRKPLEPLGEQFIAGQKGPDEEYEESRVSQVIGAALMRVSIEHREVLILRHFLAYSYQEIGSILGIPEKTVKSRLFAARRQMGRLLPDLGATAPESRKG